jgi:uncharacterized membrane-anchored protein
MFVQARTYAPIAIVLFFSVLTLTFGPANGQSTADARERELVDAFAAAKAVAQNGPSDVKLADQAALRLPEKYVYVPPNEAGRLLYAMGNTPGEDVQGLIFPGKDHELDGWFVVVRWVPEGYVKDDDARDWDADVMLEEIKKGTKEANRERRARGIPELEIIDWVEKPTYDPANNQLVWSISSKDKDAADGDNAGINYNTFALGREGFFSMNLVTDLKLIEDRKPIAKKLLASLTYDQGKRYADFNASTDKVAAYGLAALVGVAAAKKFGLFALIGVALVKFWKILAVAAVAVASVFGKRLKSTKSTGAPPSSQPPV